MNTVTAPLWIDSEYDHGRASDGVSRYTAYVRDRAQEFADLDKYHDGDVTVPFAVQAWRVARGPIMSPPLVHAHPRIASVFLGRNEYDGNLMATVELFAPLPKCLEQARPVDGGYFRDHSEDIWSNYHGVSGEDVVRSPYLLTTVTMLTMLPIGTLPQMFFVPRGQALESAAHTTVRRLVPIVCRHLQPVIDAFDTVGV